MADAQKQFRINWCKEIIRKYDNSGSKAVYDITTGDKAWIYEFELKSKGQLSECFQLIQIWSKLSSNEVLEKAYLFFWKTFSIVTVALERIKNS